MNELLNSLKAWNKNTSERVKLQHTYIVLAVALLFAAGIVSLLNGALGFNVLNLAFLAAGAFILNAVVWGTLTSSLVARLNRRTNTRK